MTHTIPLVNSDKIATSIQSLENLRKVGPLCEGVLAVILSDEGSTATLPIFATFAADDHYLINPFLLYATPRR